MSSTLLRQTPNPSAGPDGGAGRLFHEHSDRIYAFCRRRLGCSSDAEDAVQTTFLYAHRALQRGVVPESESAWLFAIAKNVCRSQHRTLARRGSASGQVDVDRVASPEPFDDGQETLHSLENALAAIPEKQRHALLLREWRGLTSSEVASHLGMSGPATYALLTRARRSLAQAMTAAARPALGVVSLVYELRSQLKALFGGVTAKGAATAAVAVAVTVTVTTGGVSAAGARGETRSPGPAPEATLAQAASVDPGRVSTRSGSATTASPLFSAGGDALPRSGRGVPIGDEVVASPSGAAAAVGGSVAGSASPATPSSTSSARAPNPDGILSETIPDPELPPLPELELPPVPGVELPPVPDLEAPVEVPGELPLDSPLDADLSPPLDLSAGSDAPAPPPAPAPEDLLP